MKIMSKGLINTAVCRLFTLLLVLIMSVGLQVTVFKCPATADTLSVVSDESRTLNDAGGGLGSIGGFDFGDIGLGTGGNFGGSGSFGVGLSGFDVGGMGFGGGEASIGCIGVSCDGGVAGGSGGGAGIGVGGAGGGGTAFGSGTISIGSLDIDYSGTLGGVGVGGGAGFLGGVAGFGGGAGFGTGEVSVGCLDVSVGGAGATGSGGQSSICATDLSSFGTGFFFFDCDCSCDGDDGGDDTGENIYSGVNNGVTLVITISLENGAILSYPVTPEGMLISDAQYTSPDELVSLFIPAGTYVLNQDGTPTYLNDDADILSFKTSGEIAPEGYALVSAHKFYPNGVTFSKPITLTIKSDSNSLPKRHSTCDCLPQ